MRPCHYCGHENDDVAVHCVGCGTEIQPQQDVVGTNSWKYLKGPGPWVWVIAVVVVAQGIARLTLTPYDPSQGEGDYKRVEAAFYLWLSLGVGAVLFAYGCYLVKKHKSA
jgi:hypothetical protein